MLDQECHEQILERSHAGTASLEIQIQHQVLLLRDGVASTVLASTKSLCFPHSQTSVQVKFGRDDSRMRTMIRTKCYCVQSLAGCRT